MSSATAPQGVKPQLRPFTARYRLIIGARGSLYIAAENASDAMTVAMDAIGDQLVYCWVKPIKRSAQ